MRNPSKPTIKRLRRIGKVKQFFIPQNIRGFKQWKKHPTRQIHPAAFMSMSHYMPTSLEDMQRHAKAEMEWYAKQKLIWISLKNNIYADPIYLKSEYFWQKKYNSLQTDQEREEERVRRIRTIEFRKKSDEKYNLARKKSAEEICTAFNVNNEQQDFIINFVLKKANGRDFIWSKEICEYLGIDVDKNRDAIYKILCNRGR